MPMNVVQIDDAADSRIADYQNLTDARLLRRALSGVAGGAGGLFMAEGELVVRRLLRSRFRTRSILLTPRRLEAMREVLESAGDRLGGAPIYCASQEVMDGIAGFHIHRGILAAGERAVQPGIEDLLRRAGILLILEDLANHDNVGGIFRAAAALAGAAGEDEGGAAVLHSPRTCDPLYRKSLRVSLGAVLHVPFARLEPWPGGLGRVRDAGFRVVALTPDPSALPMNELFPNIEQEERVALLLGAEGPGLSAEAFGGADLRVRIPMRGPMDSLNVVVAAGIALHRLTGP